MKRFKEFTTKLNEGFLDDDNEEQLTADSFANVKEEEKQDDKPFPDDSEDELGAFDTTTDNDDIDLSDELGTADDEEDATEKEDLADLKLDELEDDDDVKDSGDEKAEEEAAEQEEAELTATSIDSLKDAIATLTTKIEALTDKVDNTDEENADASAEGGDDLGLDDIPSEGGDNAGSDASLDLGGEGGSSEGGADLGLDSAGGEESSGEGGDSGSAENNDSGSSEGDSGNANEGSDEDFGDDESDNTKSEAYNAYLKHGQILNSNSGSLIGKVLSGKTYDLSEKFMNIVNAKIRQRIERKKQELKDNHFNEM